MTKKLSEAFISMPDSGICELDIEKAVAAFTPKCFITTYDGDNGMEYRIVGMTHKKNITVKATISEEQALILKDKLKLVDVPSPIFRRSSTLRHPDFSPELHNY